MTQITKQQAAMLYAYDYKLVDKEGNKYRILYPYTKQRLAIQSEKEALLIGQSRIIDYSAIGNDYFILARPLSQLTEEIEHNGEKFVPVEELISIYRKSTGSDITDLDYHCNEAHGGNQFTLYGLEDEDSYEVGMPYFIYEKVMEWHFNTQFPEHTVKHLI